MKKYILKKYGNLFYTVDAVKGQNDVVACKLLIDTGASYTILPRELLDNLSYNLVISKIKVRLITASGSIIAPQIKVEWIHSLGTKFEKFPVVAHTLPKDMHIDGILGIDFLKNAKVQIDVSKGHIII